MPRVANGKQGPARITNIGSRVPNHLWAVRVDDSVIVKKKLMHKVNTRSCLLAVIFGSSFKFFLNLIVSE